MIKSHILLITMLFVSVDMFAQDSTYIAKEHIKIDSSAKDTVSAYSFSADTLQVKNGILPVIKEVEIERLISSGKGKKLDSLPKKKDIKSIGEFSSLAMQRSKLFKDTLSFSNLTTISFFAPGFGQIYNNQYYKLPILYGGVAAFTGLSIYANKQYKQYSAKFDELTSIKAPQSEIDMSLKRMNSFKTQRTLYMAGVAATYLYFVGDAVMNYKGYSKSPQKATMLSAVFPGAGQIYNKSYWKLPIIYGGMATLGYVIGFNNRGYTRFKQAYHDLTDGDDSTIDEFNGRYSETVLKNTRDSYRRYRDLGIIIMGGLYLLNIIDAHVDAYLKKYDITDDLSLRVEPTITQRPALTSVSSGPYSQNMLGVSLKIGF